MDPGSLGSVCGSEKDGELSISQTYSPSFSTALKKNVIFFPLSAFFNLRAMMRRVIRQRRPVGSVSQERRRVTVITFRGP